jgi:hypothetical protein
MIDVLMKASTVSLWCLGFYKATQPGNVLNPLAVLLSRFPLWIYKPICGCLLCMASVHTLTATIVLSWGFNATTVAVLLCAAGINSILEDHVL